MFGKNLIRLFGRHRNAANLLMALIFVAGGYSLTKLNTQFFPDFGLDIVSIRVDWPGASTGDVEANIIEAIEPEIRFLDGVDRVTFFGARDEEIRVEIEPRVLRQLNLTPAAVAAPHRSQQPGYSVGQSRGFGGKAVAKRRAADHVARSRKYRDPIARRRPEDLFARYRVPFGSVRRPRGHRLAQRPAGDRAARTAVADRRCA